MKPFTGGAYIDDDGNVILKEKLPGCTVSGEEEPGGKEAKGNYSISVWYQFGLDFFFFFFLSFFVLF